MEGKGIIIKKVRKKGHGGSHGGSWKVAYADFVTAMMAFFLLLWLVSMVAPEKKARVSHYFKSFSVFDKSGESVVGGSPPGQLGTGSAPIPELVANDEIRGAGTGPAEGQGMYDKVSKDIEESLPEFKDQVMVSPFDGGVRIELIEKAGSPMFPSGSNELTPEGKKILKGIAETLKANGDKIAVEGHTDAKGYASGLHGNWELSTERASAARRELEGNGLAPERLIRIAGYAATQPLIQEHPNDPRNRRITIVQFSNNPPAPAETGILRGGPREGKKTALVRKKVVRGGPQFDAVEQYLRK
ncbi:MAG: flagellar motor protein MotB [Thermodesulfobacteriota bacterium]